jgi:hypothetical protein
VGPATQAIAPSSFSPSAGVAWIGTAGSANPNAPVKFRALLKKVEPTTSPCAPSAAMSPSPRPVTSTRPPVESAPPSTGTAGSNVEPSSRPREVRGPPGELLAEHDLRVARVVLHLDVGPGSRCPRAGPPSSASVRSCGATDRRCSNRRRA